MESKIKLLDPHGGAVCPTGQALYALLAQAPSVPRWWSFHRFDINTLVYCTLVYCRRVVCLSLGSFRSPQPEAPGLTMSAV